MTLHTILVGVDLSDESHTAVNHAIRIARHSGAKVVLLHAGVVPSPPPEVPAAIQPTLSEYDRILREHLSEERGRLAELRERVSGQGVEISQMVIDDFPDHGICQAAGELGADMVVVGSHGRSGFKRLLLGSVAERVVRLCERDVLVARGGGDASGDGYRRLLVATDFSRIAELALEKAMALAAPEARIDVVHCWHLPPVSYSYFTANSAVVELSEPLGKYTRELGEQLIAKHRRPGLELSFRSLEAPPTSGLIEWMDGKDYELVVTGSHGRRGMRRFLLGSVAEATVRHAPCSVLVVHGTTAADAGSEVAS
ncbi:universal stress protein [Haliangium sp.]|uniref:universal stress protein n=1 Tax=Haliangium sp. TaxID=2663208 RepID=UPI003D0C75A3